MKKLIWLIKIKIFAESSLYFKLNVGKYTFFFTIFQTL